MEWSINLEAEIGNIKYQLSPGDKVIETITKIVEALKTIQNIEKILTEIFGKSSGEGPIKITYPNLDCHAEVESKLVGIRHKHDLKGFIGFDPFIGIKCTFDLLAVIAKFAPPAKILIEINEIFKENKWGELYFRIVINGQVSGSAELTNTEN